MAAHILMVHVVILSNGEAIKLSGAQRLSDPFFWYVEADIQVKFNDSLRPQYALVMTRRLRRLRLPDLCIPETGRTQGTKLDLE